MKFKEIKPGMVIHCPTEEDARALLEHLNELGYKWKSGDALMENLQYDFTIYTCYHIHSDKTLTRDTFYCATEFSDLIESEPRFKVGDKVRIRKDLKAGEVYGELTLYDDMAELIGNCITIAGIVRNGHYRAAENGYYWSDEMLEPINDSPAESPMSAVEVLEWLVVHEGTDAMYELFESKSFDSVWTHGAQEIVRKITAYEAAKKAPKPVEVEDGYWCEIYTEDDTIIEYIAHDVDEQAAKDGAIDRAMKAAAESGERVFVDVKYVCWVKEDK